MFDQGIPIIAEGALQGAAVDADRHVRVQQAPEFDYDIVRDPLPSMAEEPALRVVDKKADWVLYKRVLPPPIPIIPSLDPR